MMKMLMNRSFFDLFSEMFGDLWDMLWHHHWCIRPYLDPLTINFLSTKINRSKKTKNASSVIFRYSNNSKARFGAYLYTFSFVYILLFSET